ncbi:spore protease YyaC [Desulfuribacillus alkaliarsenatis]|uniref:spore protease YyaC n=1 Tax=Desulfuribacillus alkaliarsenatis TaxID=766136 RepID=UPI0009FF594F|nr:spore protease YyaC [Desulfuribacillus alkaliarsenatis]
MFRRNKDSDNTRALDNSTVTKDSSEVYKVDYTTPNATFKVVDGLKKLLTNKDANQDIVIVCIGTDRSTGDSLGPLVGTRLQSYHVKNAHVLGTLDEPVHAMNLSETMLKIENLYHKPFVIAIDACLGKLNSVGNITVGMGSLKPGAGVNKDLPEIGDVYITGTVNVGGFMEYLVLQNTRLSIVMNMANMIARSISIALISPSINKHIQERVPSYSLS